MKIRKATMKDAKRILNLLNSDANLTGSDELHYQSKHVKEYVLGKSFATFVYEEDKKVVGIIMANIFRIGRYAEFYNIIVDANYRGKNIGKKLSDYLIKYLRKQKIEIGFSYIEKNNRNARKLAEKLNFEKGKLFYFYYKILK